MKRFHSKLEPLQRVRAYHRHNAALALARSVQAVEATEALIRELYRKEASSYRALASDEFHLFYWSHQYRKRVQSQISALKERLQSEKDDCITMQARYKEAHIHQRMFDTLIANQKRADRKKRAKAEEDNFDDIGRYMIMRPKKDLSISSSISYTSIHGG